MIFPRPLYPGAGVGLIAPSSPVTGAETALCVRRLQEMGYHVLVGRSLKRSEQQYGYLAGSARARAGDINQMFEDSRVSAIFCVRGGYGSSQTLEYLDYGMIRQNPKIFVGYSDVTSLHSALGRYGNLVTFHGPMARPDLLPEMGKTESYTLQSFYGVCNMEKEYEFHNPVQMEGIGECPAKQPTKEVTEPRKRLSGNEKMYTLRSGCTRGRLTGGNLSVLARSLGTPFFPDTDDCILFLEDVGESIPRLHMYLTQMKCAGVLERVRGILLGDFSDCTNKGYDESLQVEVFLQQWFGGLGIPVLANVYSDHRSPMGTLPLGAWCCMDAEEGRIVFSVLPG